MQHDGGGQIFHQLVKFDEGALDFLDIVVAGAHGTKDGGGGCGAVGFELEDSWLAFTVRVKAPYRSRGTYRCLEHALVAPVCLCCLLHLGIGRVWVHNSVLPRNLFSVSLLIVRLLHPIFLQLLLETTLQLRNLCVLHLIILTPRCIRLQKLDLVLDARVQDLRLRDHRFELVRRAAVGGRKSALVQDGDLADV